MDRIVWKWKANVDKFVGDPDVVGIYVHTTHKHEYKCLVGRSGYVGFKEKIKQETKTEN